MKAYLVIFVALAISYSEAGVIGEFYGYAPVYSYTHAVPVVKTIAVPHHQPRETLSVKIVNTPPVKATLVAPAKPIAIARPALFRNVVVPTIGVAPIHTGYTWPSPYHASAYDWTSYFKK